MMTGRVLQACIVLAVGLGFASCTKAEIEQAMNRPAEIILQSSPCTPAGIASTATPEFCINVTELSLLKQDTQVDVSLTLVNRTGNRQYIIVIGEDLRDSSGTRWNPARSSGLGQGGPLPVETNIETQGTLSFFQSGKAATGLTFSLRGEIAIYRVDSRGQPINSYPYAVKRGFTLSGIRSVQPQPAQPAATSGLQETGHPGPVSASTTTDSRSSERLGSVTANAPQVSTVPPLKTKNPEPSVAAGTMPKRSTELKSSGSGVTGPPDMVGLRIGMTPDETRKIFKSRVLVSENLRKAYTEVSKRLGFTLPGRTMPTPNGEYLSGLETYASDAEGLRTFAVVFSPTPGEETIVSIGRSDSPSRSKQSTFGTFEKVLLEKYGTPTYVDTKSHVSYLYWSYDSNGTLQKPGSFEDGDQLKYLGVCPDITKLNISDRDDWVLTLPTRFASLSILSFDQMPARCGSILLKVVVNFMGKYIGHETLIRKYEMAMTGFDAAMHAYEVATARIDRARVDANEAAIKKGQQQKPEF